MLCVVWFAPFVAVAGLCHNELSVKLFLLALQSKPPLREISNAGAKVEISYEGEIFFFVRRQTN